MIATSSRGLFIVSFLASVTLMPITAQQAALAARPTFEVATIRPSGNDVCISCPGVERFLTKRNDTLVAESMHLRELIAAAYGFGTFDTHLIYGGPGWLDSQMYTIVAKREANPKDGQVKGEATYEDMFARLQALLEDRFSLKVHRESRELPIYALVVAKSGLKVKPPSCPDPNSPLQPSQPRPMHCPYGVTTQNGLERTFTGGGITMEYLIQSLLSNLVGRTPVVDRTGYTEKFNAVVTWAPAPRLNGPDDPSKLTQSDDSAGPSIFAALEEQLGLKLESTKGPVEVLVIDHVDKPSSN
jgi:uncharacterized protein (TIGR03435 family)